MKNLIFLWLCLVVVSCVSHTQKPRELSKPLIKKKVTWTLEQQVYLWTYDAYRKKGIELFHLRKDASLEDFRPHLVQLLELPESATFADILQHPKVKRILTEKLRLKIISIFPEQVSTNSSWLEMHNILEKIR